MSLTLTPQQRLSGISEKWAIAVLEAFCVLMVAFAYLSHLGYLPLDIESDEARRAVVTGEMVLSGDYITPTINGEVYLNKPPLYNYIVAGYFKLFGNYSMFAFRLQCIVAVLVTGLLIYNFTKKYTHHTIAFFAALAYVSNGRLLLYESLYGMIDTTFSLVVYTNFLLIYYFWEQQKYKSLFIFSYVACAVAFLLKGFPAIVFQGLSLLAWFGATKNLKALWSKAHCYGVFVFLGTLAPYYLLFFASNNVSFTTVISTLFSESEKRTFLEYDHITVFNHMISFPAEIFYHFLPWTIFLLALFRKNVVALIKENTFIRFITVIFSANIFVYWVSPDVYPKYLFMFVPLLYTVAFYFYFNHLTEDMWQKKTINSILIICSVILLLTGLALPFMPLMLMTQLPYLKAGFLIAFLAICSYMTIRNNSTYRIYFFAVALLISRIGFNWFVVEQRGERFFKAQAWANTIADHTRGKQLYILANSNTGNFDGMSFEIATLREEVLKTSAEIIAGVYYITDLSGVQKNNLVTDMSFENLPGHNQLFLAHAVDSDQLAEP